MAENGPQPLTADQREEIRRMLCRFGGVMEEEKSIVPVQEEVKDFQLKEIADVFNKAPSGTTVELNALTTGSYRYHIVRIGVSLFKPLILIISVSRKKSWWNCVRMRWAWKCMLQRPECSLSCRAGGTNCHVSNRVKGAHIRHYTNDTMDDVNILFKHAYIYYIMSRFGKDEYKLFTYNPEDYNSDDEVDNIKQSRTEPWEKLILRT